MRWETCSWDSTARTSPDPAALRLSSASSDQVEREETSSQPEQWLPCETSRLGNLRILLCNLSQKLFSSGLRLEISETMHPRAQVSEGASCTWSTTDSGAIYQANLTRQGTCFLLLFFSAFLAKPKSPIFVTESVMPVPAPSVNNLSYSSNYELRWSRDHEVLYKCLTQRERERNSFTGLRIISVHVSQVGNPRSKIPFLRFEDKLQEIGNVQGTWNESTCMCHYLKIFREHEVHTQGSCLPWILTKASS